MNEPTQEPEQVGQRRLVRHLDLFSGIGGFALAAQIVGGIETVGFCEIDPWARSVLTKNFPTIPIHDDVKTLNPKNYGTIELITGGYPCQPFSHAGERRGEEDDRHLWPEVRRIIDECRPRWVLCENVAGHISMGLDTVLSELETLGYSARPLVIPACAVNARHRRDRVWIIANAVCERGQRLWDELAESCECGQGRKNHAETCNLVSSHAVRGGQSGSRRTEQSGNHPATGDWKAVEPEYALGWSSESPVRRKSDGVSRRMDCDRLRGLGNSIVPQVAAEILRCMMRVDSLHNAAMMASEALPPSLASVSDF
jgi:DNA (cytosine-5)-methyltransferase 1